MHSLNRLVAGTAALVFATSSLAADFFLFPVKEMEGLTIANSSVARPLIDQKFIKRFLTGNEGQLLQSNVINGFVQQLNKSYSGSVIHPRQVTDIKIPGPYRFVNDDRYACKAAPSYGVADTYAVILGVSRASLYEVDRGANIDVLIPITLNLQFINPNLAKVVFTISETVYSPFRFTREEYVSGSKDGIIREILTKNLNAQVVSLLDTAKQGFNPQNVPIKLIDQDGKFFVTDKGFEAGFVKGEEVEARDDKGAEYIFKVVYADSGYAVLTLAYGKANVGDSFKFVFDKPADDSRKPRVMPVVSDSSTAINAISDIFTKDIGFKASFQLSPVDVNFVQTKELITRSANCVDWKKIPSMTETMGERKDPPDFLVKFSAAESPTVLLSGAGGTKTSERFHTVVTTQVVDTNGKVIYSEMGDDDYSLDKINGQGLNLIQAKEIALKNATLKMAKNVIANIKLQPKDYRVTKVDKERIWIDGLSGVVGGDKLSFSVIHSLSAKTNGKSAVIDLGVGEGGADLKIEGSSVGLPYSIISTDLPAPSKGDSVRIYTPPASASSARIMECASPIFVGQGNVAEAPYFDPLIKHAVYRSSKFTSYVNDPAFYSEANKLLDRGMFALKVERKAQDLCFLPGYVIREGASRCEGNSVCTSTVTTGVLVRLMKGNDVVKNISAGIETELGGVPAVTKKEFYGYKQLSNGFPLLNDLTKNLNLQ